MDRIYDNDDLRETFDLVVGRLRDEEMRERYADLVHLYDQAKDSTRELSIGVYGCPKMGKSTLLNSILGEVVLPTSPIPSTSLVIDIHRCMRDNYEVNCYKAPNESSPGFGGMGNGRRGAKTSNHFRNVQDVHEFLNKYASHDDKAVKTDFVEIEVRGPFENANDLLRPNIVLRDTPGAEAAAENVYADELRADTQITHEAIGRTDILLFCVSCKTIGAKSDMDFYNEFFRKRSCIHVLTQRDRLGVEVADDEIRNDFTAKLGLVPNEEEIKDIVLTGRSEGDSKILTHGIKPLIEALARNLNPESLCDKMRLIARSLLDEWERNPDWHVIRTVPRVHFEKLRNMVSNQ